MKTPNKILKHLRKRKSGRTITHEIAVPLWFRQLPFDLFRYSLSLILFVGKLGLLDNPTLENLDWWVVFLPALFLEIATGLIVVSGILLYLIGVLFVLIWFIPKYIKIWWKYRA